MPQQNSELEKLSNPDAATKAKMVVFAQCMRDEGQDFADTGTDAAAAPTGPPATAPIERRTLTETEAVSGALASTLVIGALAGLYPALRAARLAPTEAASSP
ncbi:hypothetical protein [Actinocorallia sp. A-T 12471]|uniref:hypothetical protein n=1 Tax=Actinocorallia sp. A-T 12471 TaxID=3089813 RepID=UPI0029D04DA3|nr:hypothetical protein [Actinocorallia sp. A-T 12471]MDX6740667.1 hypothetical protein [Actinocorallia sp. A-T 12471]